MTGPLKQAAWPSHLIPTSAASTGSEKWKGWKVNQSSQLPTRAYVLTAGVRGQGPRHIGQQQLWWLSDYPCWWFDFRYWFYIPNMAVSILVLVACISIFFCLHMKRTPLVNTRFAHPVELPLFITRRPIQRFQVFSHQFLALWRLPQHLWRHLVAWEFLDGRMLIFDGNLTRI